MTLSTDAAPASTPPLAAAPTRPPFTLDALRLILVAGGLGALGSFAFVWRGIGLNVAIVTTAGVLALLILAALERIRPAWRGAWLIAPLLFFSFAAAWRVSPLLQTLNVGLVLGLIVLLVVVFTRPDLFTRGVTGYLALAFQGAAEGGLLQPGEALVAATRQMRSAQRSAWLWAIVRGLLLAAPVLIILTALLTLADLAFSQSVRDLLRALGLDDLVLLTSRSVSGAMLAWGALGALTLALRSRASAPPTGSTPAAARQATTWLGFTEAAVVLTSVNALFLAFGVFQARYLFGGEANITETGFTYADYARRGFGELVLVALIVLGLGLALQHLTRRATPIARAGFKILAALLIVQTGVLLASAFMRMQLYEQAYGFTQLRVITQVFMIWLGALLAAYVATVLVDRPHWIALGALVSTLGFVATLDVINLDGLIARENITRDLLQTAEPIVEYRVAHELDYYYVLSLSDDALPELVALRQHSDADVRTAAEASFADRRAALEAAWEEDGLWSWSWARQAAWQALDEGR